MTAVMAKRRSTLRAEACNDHSDAYSVQDSIEVGYIDEVVSEDQFMQRVMEKAKELATLPHPFYANTKKTAQDDVRQKIADAIDKYENLAGLKK